VTAVIRITRAGPAATIQDAGRFGALRHGISASGPMDGGAFARAGATLPQAGGEAIEFTQAGLDFIVEAEPVHAAFDGGVFTLRVDGRKQEWPAALALPAGSHIAITPGAAGNYGYVRFDRTIDVPIVIGSRATNLIAGLGGFEGRALKAGDALSLLQLASDVPASPMIAEPVNEASPVRFVWGLHADLFAADIRRAFVDGSFAVSTRLDRMGVRLIDDTGVFAGAPILSLVSDAIVPGDVQILGDGTPIVLMRDHQPTGGYPRIATVITADLDRFAQLRPGTRLAFAPVTLHKARAIYLASRRR
jgi:biotin-dependent carboxylase-like uncharacterized protein